MYIVQAITKYLKVPEEQQKPLSLQRSDMSIEGR